MTSVDPTTQPSRRWIAVESPPVSDPGATNDDGLLTTSRLLWPQPADVNVGRHPRRRQRTSSQVVSEFLIVPNARKPRMLLPANSRGAAAAAVRRQSHWQARMDRGRRRALSWLLSAGVAQPFLQDRLVVSMPRGSSPQLDSIESYLCSVLGRELVVSLGVGKARANRKPVLQVFTPNGETIGYAKVGGTPLTSRLVREEADALAALNSLPGGSLNSLHVPQLLHHGLWRDFEIVVQSPLYGRTHRHRRATRVPLEAMRELGHALGVTAAPLTSGAYWTAVRQGLKAFDPQTSAEFLRIADRIERTVTTDLLFGSWHGDWTPWNMAWTRGRAMVWDWERFSSTVPLGLDLVHYLVQCALTDRVHGWEDATTQVAADLPRLLPRLDVPAESADVLVILHLLTLASRYGVDMAEVNSERLRAISASMLEVLQRRVPMLVASR
jgi:hypothetical protein